MIKDRRYTLPITGIREENEEVRTFSFNVPFQVMPGQFIMLTDFKNGEKPFSVSDFNEIGGLLSVTVKKIGNFTESLFKKRKGDYLSLRGAFGSSFYIPGPENPDKRPVPEPLVSLSPSEFHPVLCGGGFGLPPLYLLAKRLLDAGVPARNISLIAAARTEGALLFEEQFLKLGLEYTGAAEDLEDAEAARLQESGCGRICGTAADAVSEITTGDAYSNQSGSFVYASGPDLMMKSLIPHIPGGAEYQFLFERYMKCAIGICGSCVTDPGGIRICTEGPALWKSQVEQLKDFGVYRRSASGAVEYFDRSLR